MSSKLGMLAVLALTGAGLAAGVLAPDDAAAKPREGAVTVETRSITLAGARRALDAAMAEIDRRGVTGTVAVTDAAGYLVALRRAPGTFVGGDDVSLGKAWTASAFQRKSRVFEEAIGKGRASLLHVPHQRWMPLVGGVPITIDGSVVGAVAVSGASSADEDEEIAIVAVAAAESAKTRDGGGADRAVDADVTVLEDGALTTEAADTALAGAVAEARSRGVTGAIAVADATGHLVVFERIDGTFPAGDLVAAGKARTAALFRNPTRKFEGIITGGRTAMVDIPFLPMTGGVPIVVDGRVVGSVGVAGASSADEDEALAQAGVDALTGGNDR